MNAITAMLYKLKQDVESLKTIERPASQTSGWLNPIETWTYASASTITVPGNRTAAFVMGTKIKLTQTTVKYFLVTASTYVAPNTTFTVTGGTDYTLANAPITDNYLSYYAVAPGFPAWFTYTCTASGSGGSAGTYAEGNAYAKFNMLGRVCHVIVRKQITNLGSWSGDVRISYPVSRASSTAPIAGGGYVYANTAAAASPKAIGALASGANANFYKTALALLQWSDLAANDWVLLNCTYDV